MNTVWIEQLSAGNDAIDSGHKVLVSLVNDVKRMIEAWKEGYFDYNLDHACAEYGGCPFKGACQMRDPINLLNQQFERRKWDPVARTETLL